MKKLVMLALGVLSLSTLEARPNAAQCQAKCGKTQCTADKNLAKECTDICNGTIYSGQLDMCRRALAGEFDVTATTTTPTAVTTTSTPAGTTTPAAVTTTSTPAATTTPAAVTTTTTPAAVTTTSTPAATAASSSANPAFVTTGSSIKGANGSALKLESSTQLSAATVTPAILVKLNTQEGGKYHIVAQLPSGSCVQTSGSSSFTTQGVSENSPVLVAFMVNPSTLANIGGGTPGVASASCTGTSTFKLAAMWPTAVSAASPAFVTTGSNIKGANGSALKLETSTPLSAATVTPATLVKLNTQEGGKYHIVAKLASGTCVQTSGTSSYTTQGLVEGSSVFVAFMVNPSTLANIGGGTPGVASASCTGTSTFKLAAIWK